jgi:hypothetical protein
VYAYAALCGLTHFGLKLNRKADLVAQPLTLDPTTEVWAPAARSEHVLSAPTQAQPAAAAEPPASAPAGESVASRALERLTKNMGR